MVTNSGLVWLYLAVDRDMRLFKDVKQVHIPRKCLSD